MKFYPTDIDLYTDEISVHQEDFTNMKDSRHTVEKALRKGGWHRIEFDDIGLYFESHPEGGLILQFYQDDTRLHHGFHYVLRDVITVDSTLEYGREAMQDQGAKILMEYGHLIPPALNWLALAAKITQEEAMELAAQPEIH